ncbi:MAG: ribbon-helix-helix domain-containing protein [Nitrospirae bacterium]|nr:ribbon-helix-helix domain-containing protein [Nitrospirota bacterium]
MLAVRLDEEIESRLEKLAKETHRPKSYYVREAVRLYLDEQEDYEIALSRLHDHSDKIISSIEMRKRLGL